MPDEPLIPPTYPMRPWQDMGDYYRSDPAVTLTGVVKKASIQAGTWWLEPLYARATGFMLHTGTGKCFSRTKNPIHFGPRADSTIDRICKLVPGDNWLHCFYQTNIDPGLISAFAIGVVDIIDFRDTYIERRRVLEKAFKQLGIKIPVQDHFFYLVPRYSEMSSVHLWHALRSLNTAANRVIFNGIVAKREISTYEKNNDDWKHQSTEWHIHPFEHPMEAAKS